MKKSTITHVLAFAFMGYGLLAQAHDFTHDVNPFIGASTSIDASGINTFGKTFPGAATPFGAVQVSPDEFEEYRIPQEPILIDESIELIKDYIKENKMSVVSFLKAFPRRKRVEIVDILRGASPLPIDYKELKLIGKSLNISNEELYSIWETRMKQVLETSGMNIYSNSELVNSMFGCAKKYLMSVK